MHTPHILLVEDDPNDEELTRLALEENRVKNDLVVARDGAEAIKLLFGPEGNNDQQLINLPQVVLLDLKLPKMSGLEVLQRIRSHERTKFLPVVIFTSSKEERDLVESYQLGANAYVRKPVDFSEFSTAVKQLGLFWVVLNMAAPDKGISLKKAG